MSSATDPELNAALAALRRDWSRLRSRIRTLEHDVTTTCSRLTLRLHFPALRDARATLGDLVDAIALFVPNFCLPRGEVEEVYARKDELEPFDLHQQLSILNARAADLFMRAQAATGRSGEPGELLLFLLTEWILEAPQIVAKMSLKTNRDMPVHGSDGIHVKFVPATRQLLLFSGEAKFHANVSDAVRSAMTSISEALTHPKLKREVELVRRDLDLSGLPADAREALLGYLDPFNERSNRRIDVVTCLIGFDFAGYGKLGSGADADADFCRLAEEQLRRTAGAFARALEKADLANRAVELFLFPLPSVQELRDLFGVRIGRGPA